MGGAAWGLSKQELRDALVHAFAQKQVWAARCLELVREIDAQNIAGQDGCTSLTAWLNGVLRVTPGVARKMQATAKVLDDTACTATAAALAEGVVNEAQAAVIGRCVTGLADCGPEIQAAVQDTLLELAGIVDANGWTPAVDYALRQADPDAADERARKRLDEAEKRAAGIAFSPCPRTAPAAPACPASWAPKPRRS